MLGPLEAFQAVLAKIAESQALGRTVENKRTGHARDQHLPTVGGRLDARGAIERAAEIVAIAHFGGARMSPDAHFKRTDHPPRLDRQRALHHSSGRERRRRLGKSHAERIPHRFENVPPGGEEGGAHQFVVTLHGGAHLLRVFFPQARAAHDVGEDKGHGSLRHIHRRE
jgi:hypothetical protein